MKVKFIKTGEVKELETSYALRLVDAGTVIPVEEKKKTETQADAKGDGKKGK